MREKTLLKLLKTQKNELDIKVLDLNKIIEELKQAQLEKSLLKEDIAKEEKLMISHSNSFIFGNFFQHMEEKVKLLQINIATLEGKILEKRNELKECFAQYKRYEFLIKKIQLIKINKEKIEEMKSFDEFYITLFSSTALKDS
ncbi:hypothetical protein Cyrtocomes_01053 [Candidatus Cyrtobacter comes]|uniref:Flagellar FliJ protein n=1 Tax=Candidatus Cyrtobacter comes TaxID=675776 RepID=A0ABU5L963_9RICK|nr:flagellar FliJ family protein [Candidatus Cyrtobacter comes]MDZ5762662.1 hypothetical protein [Candidatus Cyrtobacter comes]